MTGRLKRFLIELAKKDSSASMYYPPTVGELDEAAFGEDLADLRAYEADGLLIITNYDPRRRGVRVELTDPNGREWAAELEEPEEE